MQIELLELRKKRLGAPPVPLEAALEESLFVNLHSSLPPGLPPPPPASDGLFSKEAGRPLEYRQVLCKGHYDENNSIFLGPRGKSIYGVTEKGYFLITPLLPSPSR